MKLKLIHQFALAVVLFVISLLAAPAFGALAFALPVAAFLNLNPAPLVLGTSYPVVNATTAANQVTDTPKAREEKWVRSVLLDDTSGSIYQTAPLAEGGFMGRIRPGDKANPKILQKCIVEVMDTQKVAGNTINIATRTGLGGPGVSGENMRDGTEQKIHVGSYQLKIGRFFFSVGYTAIARDETFQGPMYERWIKDELRFLHAKKRNDDHLMRLREATTTGVGANNIVYPEGVTSVATLKTANVLDTTLINNMGDLLPSLGGLAMDTTDDSGGSIGELFMVFSSDRALSPIRSEPAYIQGLQNADVRGDMNRIFKGGFKYWNGHGIYSWIHRDHPNRGPIGSPLLPRARLGAALTGANSNSIIHGGGLVCSATVDNTNADATNTGDTGDGIAPNYFEFFNNSPYTYYNGDTIAADTATDRYLLILNSDGSYACYNFRVNNGKAIIIRGRTAIGVGVESYTHAKGALIVECNVLGVPIGYTHMLGAQALVCGVGTINGSPSDPKIGEVQLKNANYGMDLGIGVEGVWGNAAVKRAGDLAYPNFLLAKHAVPVQGAPLIP